MLLLSRDSFRNAVFKRDNHKCVICGAPAKDAHHIIERRLFRASDELGGYFLDNGASLCEVHHIDAEKTTISCDEIRVAAGIKTIVVPEHLYSEFDYDKWGNIITTAGRLKGELYYDESVQRILVGDFIKYVKYPRTYHVPWATTIPDDDRKLHTDAHLHGREVVATVKMDGQNFTGYNDYCHTRSIDGHTHPSMTKAKSIWFRNAYLLSDDMRAVCENMYAKHTIYYQHLPGYLLLNSFWIDDLCLGWNETLEYAQILDLPSSDVIYRGIYNQDKIIEAYTEYQVHSKDPVEGYVIRVADEFRYSQFHQSICKYVEPDFKQQVNDAHGHWISRKIEPNLLA